MESIESLDKINMLASKIKFTLEIEQNQKIAFLDVQLIRNTTKQNLDRTVFRKTNRSNATVPFDCSSPISYKLAPFNYYIKRAFEVCLNHLLKEELDASRKIAIENAIPSRFIEKIINKFEVGDYGKRSAVIGKRFKFCKVNYIPRLFKNIRHTLFKYDVKLIAATPPKLKVLLNTKIDPVQAINRSGVYIIPFQKDSKYFIYVGMTMRKFRDRIKKHEADLRLNRPHTALSRDDSFNESFIRQRVFCLENQTC